MSFPIRSVLVLLATTGLALPAAISEAVAEHVPIAANEHPRLFFRTGDLPRLRERAATPEGRAIIARLRLLLDGDDGEGLPADIRGPDGRPVAAEQVISKPFGSYTLWHAAGYGMLYRLTGELRYADHGRRCVEAAMAGQRDRDGRYAFRAPKGALRAGPSLAAIAMGYDLCYDGWDPAFRTEVARAIAGYAEGTNCSLPDLARGSRHHPGSNHWGPQIGGAALAILAVLGDDGVDQAALNAQLEVVKQSLTRQLHEGMGERGYYHEHPGPGQIASDTAFVPALQAMRTAAGLDFTANDTAQWLALRWVMWLVPTGNGGVAYPNPRRFDSYGGEDFDRDGLSRGGQFVQGMGIVEPRYLPALRWTYERFIVPSEAQLFPEAGVASGQSSYDTVNPYPHRAVLALVHWPIGVAAVDPDEIMPHVTYDGRMNHYCWRNRWQDGNDTIVNLALGARNEKQVESDMLRFRVWSMGQRLHGHAYGGKRRIFEQAPDGSSELATDAFALAIDFSGASGADVVVAVSGKLAMRWEERVENRHPNVPAADIDLNGAWGDCTFRQQGDAVTIVDKHGKDWATGTLAGRTLTMDFGGKLKLTGELDPTAREIAWSNDTSWARNDRPLTRLPTPEYQPGDPIRRHELQVGGQGITLLIAAEDGDLPEPRVEGSTIVLGDQRISLEDGILRLANLRK